jgi:hypothetical protein
MKIASPFLNPTVSQLTLFQTIWGASASGTRWPTFEFVEDALDAKGLAALDVVTSCPKYRGVSYGPLWWPTAGPPRRDRPIVITIAGLAHCPEARAAVDAFLSVVRAVADTWRALPQDPGRAKALRIRYADIAEVLIDGSLTAPKQLVDTVISLFDHEPPTWGGNKSGEGTEWTWEVSAEIKHYGAAHSAIEYMSLIHDQIGDKTNNRTNATAIGDREGNDHPKTAPVFSPSSRLMQHAFISYVHEDKREVDQLQQSLEAADIPIWRDTKDLWPGEEWKTKIRDAITSNSLVFIACFSDNSVSKPKSYQNEELLLAIDQFRQRKPGDPWLIPVRLSDCKLPNMDIGAGRSLESLHRVNLFGADSQQGVARLVATVVRMMDHQTAAKTSDVTADVALPSAYLLNAVLTATRSQHEVFWNLHSDLYIEVDPKSTLVIPEHTCHGKVTSDELRITGLLERFGFHMPFGDTPLVQALPGQVAYRGPGTSNLICSGLGPLPQESNTMPRREVTVDLELWPALSDRPLIFKETLQPTEPSDDTWGVWIKRA